MEYKICIFPASNNVRRWRLPFPANILRSVYSSRIYLYLSSSIFRYRGAYRIYGWEFIVSRGCRRGRSSESGVLAEYDGM